MIILTCKLLAVVLGACYMYATHTDAGYAPLIAQTAVGWFLIYAWEFPDERDEPG